jgi:D-alanine transaminase
MENPVYLNGEFLPLSEARISVLDRGFLFGDGVYEVIPAYGGRPFRLAEHLQRLQRSLDAIRLNNPYSDGDWRRLLQQLLARTPGEDQGIYLQITRGAAPKRDHAIPAGVAPTVFAMCSPILPPSPQIAAEGIDAVSREDSRWLRCDIKAITLLANVLLRAQAADEDALEAILIRDGQVTEGAASNLFLVRDGRIATPPKSELLLAGITRDLILELAQAQGLPWEERPIAAAELVQADELWLSSSTRELLPVTRLDGQAVANGRPGPIWQQMNGYYQDYKASLRTSKAEQA